MSREFDKEMALCPRETEKEMGRNQTERGGKGYAKLFAPGQGEAIP